MDGDRVLRSQLKFLRCWSFILVAAVGSAQAQQPARLTLQSALELADKQNLNLAAARRRRAVGLAGIQIAEQRPNPSINFAALRDEPHEGLFLTQDRKSTRLNSSHIQKSRMPSSA